MKLKTINNILRKFGIVLVVEIGDNFEPIVLRRQQARSFK
jgi:hypothetical protein